MLPQGGRKCGVWDIQPDGSGTWTRSDPSATRCRTLCKSGPARHEVHERVTVDAVTGQVLHTLPNFDTAKILDQELPPPCPRAIKSIFRFKATKACIPDAAKNVSVPDAPDKCAGARAVAPGVHDERTGRNSSCGIREPWQPPLTPPTDRYMHDLGVLGAPKLAGGGVIPVGQAPRRASPAPNTWDYGSDPWAGGDRRYPLRPGCWQRRLPHALFCKSSVHSS